MQLKEFNIIVDIKRNKEIDSVEVVQKDYESNIFNITILNDLNPYNLEGLNVEIAFAKPDGTTVLQDEENRVVITNASEGELYCILNTNTIAAAGKVFAEVRILQDLKVLTTASFNFYVRKAIVDDKTIESTNEIPILKQLTNDVQGVIATETDRVHAEDIRVSNEVDRVDNENNRVQAEQDRTVTFEGYETRVSTVESDLSTHKLDYANLTQDYNRHKLDYAEQMDLKLKNKIENGDFSNTTGLSGNFTTLSVENNILTATISTLTFSTGYYGHSSNFIAGHKYYIKNDYYLKYAGSVAIGLGSLSITYSNTIANAWNKISTVITATINETRAFIFYVDSTTNYVVGDIIQYKKAMCIDLTTTFGEDNEPTKEEMDILIDLLGGWFDGEITLSQKQLAIWTLNMIRQNRNAIISLGGTIV